MDSTPLGGAIAVWAQPGAGLSDGAGHGRSFTARHDALEFETEG